jgi:hypothetical protein
MAFTDEFIAAAPDLDLLALGAEPHDRRGRRVSPGV